MTCKSTETFLICAVDDLASFTRDHKPHVLISNFDHVHDAEKTSEVVSRLARAGCRIYHLDKNAGGTFLYRRGVDVFIRIELGKEPTSPFLRILSPFELYEFEKYLQRILRRSSLVDIDQLLGFMRMGEPSFLLNDYLDMLIKFEELKDSAISESNMLEGENPCLGSSTEFEEAEEPKGRSVASQSIRRRVASLRKSDDVRLVRLQPTAADENGNFTFSLLPNPSEDLTRWIVDGSEIQLENHSRYMFLWKDTGDLAYTRVAMTRMTFFERSVLYSGDEEILDTGLYLKELKFSFDERRDDVNLRIKVWQVYGSYFYLDCLCDGAAIRIKESLNEDYEKAVPKGLKGSKREVASELARHVTQPFVYKKRLSGVQANQFFVGYNIDDLFELQLVELSPGHYAIACEYVPE